MTTQSRFFLRRGARTLAFACVGVASCAAATAFAEVRAIDFLPAVQSAAQNARVTLVNLTPLDARGSPPDPCFGKLAYFDLDGNVVGDVQSFRLASGAGAQFVAPQFTANAAAGLMTLRARVIVRANTPAQHASCAGLAGSYEVFNTRTLETQFMNPGVIRGFNPQPDPPGFGE
jgi:hypothetical protein